MILDTAPTEPALRPAIALTPTLTFGALGPVRVAHDGDDGSHLIIADPAGDHRLWLRAEAISQPLSFIVIHDSQVHLRLAAIARLSAHLSGKKSEAWPRQFRISAYRRHRLRQLLNVLDASLSHASARDIATHLIYRHTPLISRSAWKDSNERRHTRRLIDEAHHLMRVGYRALVNGC